MNFFELFFISIGLSMDAFAVSVCKGLTIKENRKIKALTVGVYFGFFQAIMPLMRLFSWKGFCKVNIKYRSLDIIFPFSFYWFQYD